jgi:ferredoxin-NADP reductase
MLASLTRAPRRSPVARIATLAWRRLFLDRHADFWLRELRPSWSIPARHARVIEVIDETPDTKTYVLAPSRDWPGHRAGQFVSVAVEIDGVRVRRCYSISSGASEARARRIAITVRRVPGGRVSSWLHDQLQPGAVIGLGQPAGEFVVSTPAPARLLFVAGGSGITPVMAILRDLADRGQVRDIVVVHGARSETDAIFRGELAGLAATLHGLRLIVRRDGDPVTGGRLDAATLRSLVPDLAERETYVCGTAGLMDVVTDAVTGAGAAHRLHHERFVTAPVMPPRDPAAPANVHLLAARRLVVVGGAGSLLDQLERAGERPVHGCRIGICNTCRCHKQSGSVENTVTGVVSSEPDQEIKLCISIARSDLELAL